MIGSKPSGMRTSTTRLGHLSWEVPGVVFPARASTREKFGLRWNVDDSCQRKSWSTFGCANGSTHEACAKLTADACLSRTS